MVYDPSTHPSIVEIKNHVDIDNNFDFQNITAERVEKIINTINIKKATGADNIPAKVVRQCKVTVVQQLSSLINFRGTNRLTEKSRSCTIVNRIIFIRERFGH